MVVRRINYFNCHKNMRNLILKMLKFVSICYCLLQNATDYDLISDFDYITYQDREPYHAIEFQIPDEKWTSVALKAIAHYLRNYKFNEWDRRYYNDNPVDSKGFFESFPKPAIKTLHWKVVENCHSNNFYKCILYLYSIVEIVPFGRNNDIVTFVNENAIDNNTVLKQLNTECKATSMNSDQCSFPFESLIEKFIWRTTASYYMCWYTMQDTPALSMLGEACDNFANCLDSKHGSKNHDPRCDDRLSFQCAQYSFCPDPCCPLKHIHNFSQCYNNSKNPCFEENRDRFLQDKECTFDRKSNKNLQDMINNKWNVSCKCKNNGFIWKSRFGICIDINECSTSMNMCDSVTEDCLNTPGSYICICKWGFEFNYINNTCIRQINLV